VPAFICEALSRRLRRVVTLADAGFAETEPPAVRAANWHTDTLGSLHDLSRADIGPERHRLLAGAEYAVAASSVPPGEWWDRMADTARGSGRRAGEYTVGHGDVAAVRETVAFFSRMDQRHGGGHARRALVLYLQTDVGDYLGGRFADDRVRRDLFAAASELAYLAGWTAFDDLQHAIAQPYFVSAVKLAAMAGDPPMAAHVLRAMALQSLELGHHREALRLASAAMQGSRYTRASPKERALVGVVHARALAATGDKRGAMVALRRAEDDLATASPGIEEPHRTFFFGEAALAHEAARTLASAGDTKGAIAEFRRSVRTRNATAFARTHTVTLGRLAAVQAATGAVEEACATWGKVLDGMDGVRSGRARQIVVDLRRALSPFRKRGVAIVAELDRRAAHYTARPT
jgi:hypothetical protein